MSSFVDGVLAVAIAALAVFFIGHMTRDLWILNRILKRLDNMEKTLNDYHLEGTDRAGQDRD